ncbi:MAG: hypothetical protein AABZ08_01870 [Planctomycetota bacterium]
MSVPDADFDFAFSDDAEDDEFWGLLECAEVTIPLSTLAYAKADESRRHLALGTQRNEVLANVTKTRHNEKKFQFETTEDCQTFFERLRVITGDQFLFARESWGQLDVIRRRGWIPLIAGGFTFLAWTLATDIAAGREFLSENAKSKFFYTLLRPILERLGPLGTLAVGIAITVYCLFTLIRLFERPPTMLILEQKRGRASGHSRYRPSPLGKHRW